MRKYNIDREQISSEQVADFKDFQSILKKHAQSTQNLSKIKSLGSFNKIYWTIGGFASLITIVSLLLFSGESKKVVHKDVVENVSFVDAPAILWKTLIRTPKNSIEKKIGVNAISANRVNFVRFNNSVEVNSLLKNVQKTDADFVSKSLVFKVENKEVLEISKDNDLYRLNEDGRWDKVEYVPMEIPYIEKPILWKKGEFAVQPKGIPNGIYQYVDGLVSEYESVVWKPVNLMDLDESFFKIGWKEMSVKKTSVKGVYNLIFKFGEIEKSFNGYPALPKTDYKKAMKEYNRKLVRAQENLKKSPKEYHVSSGIYTLK
jgi:hypothetical protein